MHAERAEAFFLCLIARCRSLRIALGKPPTLSSLADEKRVGSLLRNTARRWGWCPLLGHGGARSGARDDDGRGSQAPRIACRCPGRASGHALRPRVSEEGSGLQRAILASGASNQALREQLKIRAASVGNRAPPHGGGASRGVLSSASDDDGGGSQARCASSSRLK
jgi:hypothetical protein